MQVIIGFKKDSNCVNEKLIVEDTEDPDGTSDYITMIKFDNRLMRFLMIEEVESVDDLMENVPIFCLDQKFKKLLWEEVNRPVIVEEIAASRNHSIYSK